MRTPASVGAIARVERYATPVAKAFSLIDILVSLSVIALLISILLPTLGAAQEATRRVVCASNMHQMGLATQNFALGNMGDLPTSIFDARNADQGLAEETIFLLVDQGKRAPTLASRSSRNAPAYDTIDSRSQHVWDGLGHLYKDEYVNHHACFYCPSHRGQHAEHVYRPNFLNHNARELTQGSKEIAGNYQLRLGLKRRNLNHINATVALMSDAVRTQVDYNHINGNNLYRADLSVSWFADTSGALWNTLASGDEHDVELLRSAVRKAWEMFDGTVDAPLAE